MNFSMTTCRGALAVLFLAALAAGCGTTAATRTTTAPATRTTIAPAPTMPGAAGTMLSPTDVDLVMHAAQDSIAEVRLGHLAQQRGGSDAVRQLGQRLVADHSQANAELLSLAQQRGLSIPQSIDPQHYAVEQRLSMLTGPQFDIAFLEQMIADHAKGVAMLERAAGTATDPAVRAWAARHLPVIRQHQAMTHNLHAQLARGVTPSASPVILPR